MNAATRFIQISLVAALFVFTGVGFAAPTTDFNINSDPPIVQPTGDRFEDDGSEHGMWNPISNVPVKGTTDDLYEDDGSEHGMWNQFAYNTTFIFPSPDEEVEDDGTEWD